MTDEEQLTEEFAWVHQAYAAIPATEPEVLGRVIAAAVAEVSGIANAHTDVAVTNVRRQGRRTSWARWSPWIALAAGLCIVAALGARWHQANLAKRKVLDTLLQRDLLSSSASLNTVRGRSGEPTNARTPLTPLGTTPSSAIRAHAPAAAADNRDVIPSSSQAPDVATSPSTARARAVDGLDPASATLMVSLLNSAQARGLPIDGVTARIHEGVSRGVPSQQIVGVARNYVASLDNARTALGASATVDELQAGAEALQAGAPASALKQLRAARPSGSIVEPLIALADLSTHKVAPLQASTALSALVARDRSDAPVRALRAAVINDIIQGAMPDAALAYRARSNALAPTSDGADSMSIHKTSP
jgi:hypothetical protein